MNWMHIPTTVYDVGKQYLDSVLKLLDYPSVHIYSISLLYYWKCNSSCISTAIVRTFVSSLGFLGPIVLSIALNTEPCLHFLPLQRRLQGSSGRPHLKLPGLAAQPLSARSPGTASAPYCCYFRSPPLAVF